MKHLFKDAFLDNSAIQGEVEQNVRRWRMGDFSVDLSALAGEKVQSVSLKQTGHHFKFGATTFMLDGYESPEQNRQWKEKFLQLFNLGIVGTFWKDYEPSRGVYRFDKNSPRIYRRPPIDVALEFCRENGLSAKGHNLLWHDKSTHPDWVDPDKTKIMPDAERYIEALGARYRDVFDYVDVVNEHLCRGPFACDHWDPKEAVMPQDYVDKAFDKAAAYFSKDTRLMTNENHMSCWVEYRHDSTPYYVYLKHLLASGRRVEGIGMQYHAFISTVHEERFGLNMFRIEALYDMLMLYNTFGLPMHLSEITIPSTLFGEAVNEELQARIADSFYRLWFSIPNMDAIIWWNLSDGAAHNDEDKYKGALLRGDLSEKPVYNVLDRLINKEWKTEETLKPQGNTCSFRGFYGKYEIEVRTEKGSHTYRTDYTPEQTTLKI